MSRELEDTKYAEDPEGDERTRDVVIVLDTEADVVRHYGDDVDHRHHRACELASARGREQPEQILRGEDHHAGSVQTEEHDLVPLAARERSGATGPDAARHRLHHVRQHAHRDEEPGDIIKDQRRRGRVRVLKRAPHLLARVGELLERLVAVLAQLVVHQSLRILSFSVPIVLVAAVADDVRQDAEERQLLVVAGETLVLRVVELTGAVVVENVPKDVRVAVEEVLLALLVVEELALVRAEQRVRVLLEGVAPGLESASAHVDQELLVVGLATVLGDRRRRQRVRRDRHPSDGRCPGEGQPGCYRGHAPRLANLDHH